VTLENSAKSGERWLKAELHTHCNLDPDDYRMCSYSAEELVREAARLSYDVLAITCHNLDVWSDELSDYAESLGITLIPGMEVRAEGRFHTLVYNFGTSWKNLNTFEKIRTRRRPDTLVVAPHPYFPGWTSLGSLLQRNIDIFDAIEYSGFFTSRLNFNRSAESAASRNGRPLVGNSDAHLLWQLGRTFTWIRAEAGVKSVIEAIRNGQVRIETNPLSFREAASWWTAAGWRYVFPARPPQTGSRLRSYSADTPGSPARIRQ
jgi:predicted metal-dependent phosphoesterase TrpH